MQISDSEFDIRALVDEHKEVLAIGSVGILMVFLGVSEWRRSKVADSQIEIIPFEEEGEEVIGDVVIDVSGAVARPGVYRLEKGARLGQAIEAGGGFLPEADAEWVSKQINLAQIIMDGDKVYVPFTGETPIEEYVLGDTQSALINVNTANSSELESLPGIGAVRAQAIIDNRPYSQLDELATKAGLSETLVSDIEEKIRF